MVEQAIGILKQTIQIYEFLQIIIQDDLKMNVNFKDNDTEIIFTAIDYPWYIRWLAPTIPSYCTIDWNDPDKFKVIKIRCYLRKNYQDLLARFHGESKILQKEIIDYLQRYCLLINKETEEISISKQCIERGRGYILQADDRSSAEWFDWYAVKLTYVIKQKKPLI